MTSTRVTVEKELLQTMRQLTPENQLKIIRLTIRMGTNDGFFEAYKTHIKDAGGLENVGWDGINKFIDEWEATHKCNLR